MNEKAMRAIMHRLKSIVILGFLLPLVAMLGPGVSSTTGAVQAQGAGGVWTNFTNGNDVQAIAVDERTGEVWVGTSGGVVRWDPETGTYTKYTSPDGLASNDVEAIAIDTEGNKWFGTDSGVSRLSTDGTWTTYTTADGLANNVVQAIAIDPDGNKWFGTFGGGVSRLSADGRWTTYTTADGLASRFVDTIAIDTQGVEWFSTWGGVSMLDDGGTPFDKSDDRWTTYTEADGLGDNWVWAIAIDAVDNKWFGTDGGGVSMLDDGDTPFDKSDDRWATYTTADGLAYNTGSMLSSSMQRGTGGSEP